MSLSLLDRMRRVKAILYLFRDQVQVSDGLLAVSIQFERDRAYKNDLATRDWNYRKTTTVADGDLLPADYVLPAYNVYKSAVTYDYVDVSGIAGVKANAVQKFTATDPKWYIVDQKIKILCPTPGDTGVTFEYYWQPAVLWASDGTDRSAVVDNMPQDLEYSIIRGAAEKAMEVMLGKQAAFELMRQKAAENQQTLEEFFRDYLQVELRDARTR